MTPKNIDETVQKLLQGYAKRCYKILQKDNDTLQKQHFVNKAEQKKAFDEYAETKKAYDFLVKVAEEPKKYLYSGKDLIYASGNLYLKLSPLMERRFDKSGNHLLVRLGECIARHVTYGKNNQDGVWVYYGGEWGRDSDAETIISMNKTVQLWNSNDFVAAMKDFAPASLFAVDFSKKAKEK